MGGRRVDELGQILDQLEPLLGPVTAEPQLLTGGITNHNYRVGFGEVTGKVLPARSL